MKKTFILGACLLSMMSAASFAQEDAPKFKIQPTGRVLFDGAILTPTNEGEFSSGLGLGDIRVGAKATYGNWMAKIDIGYTLGKIGMKDVYVQYKFNDKNLIRGGNFVHQFGLQAATSSSMKCTFEAPVSDTYVKGTGRNLGVQYIYSDKKFFAGVSGIAGTDVTQPASNFSRVSWGGITRLVYRPFTEPGGIFQVGLSGWYQKAALTKGTKDADGKYHDGPGQFIWNANYPVRVDQVTLLRTEINDANGVVKLSPELVASKGPVALESQYFYMNVNRRGLPAFISNGVYGTFRALLFGDRSYGYAPGDAGLATPSPKTLELVLGYNYTNASDFKANICSGITNDFSVTFNYYINKYMLARLRYSYTELRDRKDANGLLLPHEHVNIIQARVQFLF